MPHRADTDKAARLAERRDGIVTRRELLADGVGLGAVDGLVSTGVMTRVLDGVFLLGGRSLTQRQLFRSALAYAGPGAALCGYSAGEQRGILTPSFGRVMVTSPREVSKQPRIQIRMTDGFPAHVVISQTTRTDFVEYDDLSVTGIARTLIEIGTSRGSAALKRAWREADFRKQLDLDDIRAELTSTRRRGSRLLRDLMDTLPPPTDCDTDIRSLDEIDFLALVAAAGLPRPEVNVAMMIGGAPYVADFFYRSLGLVVEVDDPSHRRPVAQGRDRIRDVEFFIGELDVIRFETHRLRSEPARCMRQLEAAISRQSRRVTAGLLATTAHPRGTTK